MTDWDDDVGGAEAAGDGLRHWAHHDLVVLSDGRLLTPAPDGGLLVIGDDGEVRERVDADANEIHGLTVVLADDGSCERVWVSDCGFTMRPADDGGYEPAARGSSGPRAFLLDLDGTEHASISRPDHPTYADGHFLPTAVAVDERRHGGTGDVWVTDGYGCSLVHRFDGDGRLVMTLDGTEGAGRFDCPHSIFIDRRGAAPSLLVADRGNGRVQAYDLDGGFLRCFGEGVLTSPSAFATAGDRLVVAELEARVVVLDAQDTVVSVIGDNREAIERPGWPNALDDHGSPVRPPLEPGRFNSPHGLAVEADGRLFVSEWLIGGRLVGMRLADG